MPKLTNAQLTVTIEALRDENATLRLINASLQKQLDSAITSSRPTVHANPVARPVFGFFVGQTQRVSFFDFEKANEVARKFKAAYPKQSVAIRKIAG